MEKSAKRSLTHLQSIRAPRVLGMEKSAKRSRSMKIAALIVGIAGSLVGFYLGAENGLTPAAD